MLRIVTFRFALSFFKPGGIMVGFVARYRINVDENFYIQQNVLFSNHSIKRLIILDLILFRDIFEFIHFDLC